MPSFNKDTREKNIFAVSVNKKESPISYNFDYREPTPTYYANTNIFSRRMFRRRPKTTGPICKEVLIK